MTSARPHPRLLVAALVAVIAQACGGARPSSSPSPADSIAELESLYRARADDALTRFTDADASFMTRMVAHHAQALVMAALAPDRSARPAIRTLAARISSAQETEIALMQQWLEERGLPVPALHDDAMDGHAEGSPGMLSPEQIAALERAEGEDFDTLFLSSMIQHHAGAVTMVDDLFATPGAAQDASVFRIASGIQVDQRTEISRMESMLDAFAVPGRAR